MAHFEASFEKMIQNEGGYTLHKVEGDRGGSTYAGIARKYHPDWEGWADIDTGEMERPELFQKVRDFYRLNFWDRIRADDIKAEKVSASIFDFAVNGGVKTASALAQGVVGAKPDGIIGPQTIAKINQEDAVRFTLKFTLEKVARYAAICNRDRSQSKFLLGWINRSLKDLS